MKDELTPMMQQYRRIKRQLPRDVILLFRLGDFYEMFFEDAKEASSILGIALTKRQSAPMCGVPYHSVENYIAKLLKAGRKVAICEQTEDPSVARGIVKRDVTRIITPGTVLEENVLDSNRCNFVCALCVSGEKYGSAFMDISTGIFFGVESKDAEEMKEVLYRYKPAECVIPEETSSRDIKPLLNEMAVPGMVITPYEDWIFDYETARDVLLEHFKVSSLDGYGCENRHAVVSSSGALLYYVSQQLKQPLHHVRTFHLKDLSKYLILDEATRTNLDLVPAGTRRNSPTLFDILNLTRTAMGARKLMDCIIQPLAERSEIEKRLDAVEELCANRTRLRDICETLSSVKDIERLLTRIISGSGGPREFIALSKSLSTLPLLRELLSSCRSLLLRKEYENITPLPDVVTTIEKAIVDEPPVSAREGGVIRDGYSKELDELRIANTEGKKWLAEYQTAEQQRTGIKTLKVRYNKVFGYYIEISKGQASRAPENYIRKQTLTNAERFITPELKDYENKILGAQERAIELEQEIIEQIRKEIIAHSEQIQCSANVIAELDVFSALANRALTSRYVRPVITEGDVIHIKGGRHPVIEQISTTEKFVPNDTYLNCSTHQIMLITGPNMAGKSTYIRQVALIVIMAHMGSFVPADSAEVCLVDRVFTRVGASDDLARGRSTFMVEMQETANILNNATPRSLIVLDEIGRGTSTFDGISIAWAVAEYLHNNPQVKAKTLFATHYHELTDMELTLSGVKNYNVLVREQNGRVVFLRKIVPGASDKSYGIHVAQLAGMPPSVLERAREILSNLEEGEIGEAGQPKIARKRSTKKDDDATSQLTLF
jgi:DNA mismatch repair protein MutS